MRYALIDPTGLVVNIILAGEDYEPPDGLTAYALADDDPFGIGWTLDGETWIEPGPVEPVEPTPSLESRMQAQIDELSDLTMELLDMTMGL